MSKEFNCTKKYFKERAELLDFLSDNQDLFNFVTHSCAQQDDGRWLLVY
jgi:hypothetical protein